MSIQSMRELKKPIRSFMREHYTDERLAMLLAHARDGKLDYTACCCFIGIVTANHALTEKWTHGGDRTVPHLAAARHLVGAYDAEESFFQFGPGNPEKRRRILIPMIRAEMRRREGLRITDELFDVRGAEALSADLGVLLIDPLDVVAMESK